MSWARTLIGIGLFAASFIPGMNVALAIAFRVGGVLIGNTATRAGERQDSRLDNPVSPTTPLPVIYGEQRVGIAIADMRVVPIEVPGDDLEILYLVGAICVGSEAGGGIEDVTAIWFDNVQVVNNPTTDGSISSANVISRYDGHLRYAIHLGTDSQNVDAELNSQFPSDWPSTSKGAGIAYIVLALRYDEEVYPSFPRVTLTVQGQKVYDPDTETTAYSTNNALCVLDYMTSKKYGAGVPLSRIDTESFEDAADYCDENVDTTAYSGPRFECAGIADTSSPRREVLEQILASCRGEVILQGPTYRMYIPKPETPQTFELTEQNTLGEWEFARLGHVPNTITVNFVDGDTHQTKEVTWPEAGQTNNFLTADNGFVVPATMEVSFVNNIYIAQQIGMVTLRENREDIVVSLRAHEEALLTQVGEVVPLTHSTPGWDQKLFRVAKMGILPDCTVQMLLREYDADAYSLDTQNTQDTGTDTNLADALTCQPPTGLTLSSDDDTEVVIGGVRMTRIFVEWTAADEPFLSRYEIRHRPTAESEWIQEPHVLRTLTEAYTIPVDDTVEHTVEVRAVNTLGVPSVWVSDTTTPDTIVYPALMSAASYRYIGNRLWLTLAGDANTRTSGISIVGNVGGLSTPADPTVASHDFALSNSRFGDVDTGHDEAEPPAGTSKVVFVKVRAVNTAGAEGPVVTFRADRVGAGGAPGSVTIDTFTASKSTGGTSCLSSAESSVTYDVTADPTDTVTIERYIDSVAVGLLLSASTTHSNTLPDSHPWFEDPPDVAPEHAVQYHLIVKNSGGTTLTDAWSDTVTYSGVEDC